MQARDYHERLATVFGRRAWIVAFDALAGAAPLVKDLAALGAERCLCVASSAGTGAPPDPDFAPDPIVLGLKAADLMTSIRQTLDAFASLPDAARARIDEFDPGRSARVIGSIFDDGRALAGRRKYGARPARWQELEDKTRVDALWDEVGIRRAPSRVVHAAESELGDAVAALDAGTGCVLAGDNREGFNGGATYLRWVRTTSEVSASAPFFEAHCDRVRVMPFLEGIPCSIHGLVFDDYTVALRPCEMLVLRRPGRSELHYGKAATFWDPPETDRRHMRDIARRLGDHLRATLDYRGAFTVDGIMTRDGFLPTELNPRFGAALLVLASKLELPLMLLNLAVVEGERVDWHPRELEQWVLQVADEHRSGSGMAFTDRPQTETQSASLRWTGTAFRLTRDEEQADATAVLGPSAVGGFVKVDLNPARTPVGPSVAARVAAALAFVDAHYNLGIGPLEPATDVRAELKAP